ncbi:MAG: glycosyltransferase [Gammaproteobacteria bacterium]|nr:glycosyltransferase [Gammaproteobacteria bacterium]MBU2058795.1 glycosyltransferase [Gammaproteobacteria bacterium]MBU2177142.1 glycosyltransferase [Gammaproteobacteria bacterium]MBU2247128.1 glycosyltransferase [Gammaproteobacteria bacterium]MBU2343620.1 glycosyltransferase [Gammaproteobacteria bacterium]
MRSAPLLSLIVPFYNAAHYFSELLQSIEVQLTETIQVILICDGATDGSLELAQRHIGTSAIPQSYLLLCQQNSGVSVARNQGIKHATGEYIGFIDADDLLLPGYISQLLSVIQQHKPDLIELGYKSFKETSELHHAKPRYLHRNAGWLLKNKAITEVYKASRWFSCLRVYRRRMAPNFQFPAGIAFCEDLMSMPSLYDAAQHIYHLRLPLYGYREHSASASFNVKVQHQQQLQRFFTEVQLKNSYPAMPELWRHLLLFHLAYLLYKFQLNNKNQQSFPDQLAQQLKALIYQFWWSPHFSVRKKLNLAFAPFFFRWERIKSG